MKKTLTALTIGVGLASGMLMAQAPTKIGTINLQAAVPNTAEAKAATAKLQREFVEPRTKQLEAKQAEIRDLQDKLQRAGDHDLFALTDRDNDRSGVATRESFARRLPYFLAGRRIEA